MGAPLASTGGGGGEDIPVACVLVKAVCKPTRAVQKIDFDLSEGTFHFIAALMVGLQDLRFLDHVTNFFLTSVLSKFSLPEWYSLGQCNRDV